MCDLNKVMCFNLSLYTLHGHSTTSTVVKTYLSTLNIIQNYSSGNLSFLAPSTLVFRNINMLIT
jgi:hypothetical protein